MISVINEYCILYSDRIYQKDKKWIDGKLKYYELNHKVEIFNVEGDLIKSDFKSLKLEEDKQYIIGKFIIEVIEFENKFEREIIVQKNSSNHNVTITAGPSSIKSIVDPVVSPVTQKVKRPRLVTRNAPLKHTINRGAIKLAIKDNRDVNSKPIKELQGNRGAINTHSQNEDLSWKEFPNHTHTRENNLLGSTRVGLPKLEPKLMQSISGPIPKLSFEIIEPIITRIPKESSKVYR